MNKKSNNGKLQSKKLKNVLLMGIGAIVLVGAIFIANGMADKPDKSVETVADKSVETEATNSGLVITKSELTDQAKFYPYEVNGTKMEVLAFKASDGSVRTALNTCQVCFDSGRGYYVQDGTKLVCQNCGNQFEADQVEIVKGGCNPVPIMKEDKTEDETTITISEDFLAQNIELFKNWKQ